MKFANTLNRQARVSGVGIEVLESRIAPATLVDARTVTYKDLDSGAVVTVKFSKDVFTDVPDANAVLKFSTGGVVGTDEANPEGQRLALVNIGALTVGNNNPALGASISIQAQGVAKADVGAIFAPGIPLGGVTVDGDLGRIVAGNAFFKTGLASLKVGSLGGRGFDTQRPDDNPATVSGLEPSLVSTVTGALGSLSVEGDILNARLDVLNSTVGAGNIGSVSVGGRVSGQTQYVQVQGEFTQTQAKQDAEARGGRLAVLDSGSEQTLMTSLGYTGWIGLTDAGTEGTFKWLDTPTTQNGNSTFVEGTTLGTTTNWNTGEPRITPTTASRGLIATAAPIFAFNASAAAKVDVQSVDPDADTLIFSQAHGFQTGQKVDFLAGGGSAPEGLASGRTYFVIVVDDTTVKLAESQENASAGTFLDLSSAGSSGIALQAAAAEGVKADTDKITFASDHGFVTGQAVDYLSRGGVVGVTGLEDKRTYYAVVLDSRTIQLAATSENAQATEPVVVDLLGAGGDPGEAFQATAAVGVKVDTDRITFGSAHQLSTGARLVYKTGTGGAAIGGLTSESTYYVIRDDNNSIRLATTLTNAQAGTSVDLTAAGSGSSQTLETVEEDGVALVAGGKWVTRALTDKSGYVFEMQTNGGIRSAGTIGPVNIGGKIVGGGADSSGIIFAQVALGKVTVGGNIEGGGGVNSGAVLSNGAISSVKVVGDLLGGSGASSGFVLGASIGSASLGSVQGGSGSGSGSVQAVSGKTSTLSVQGTLKGGAGQGSGQLSLAVLDTLSLGAIEGGQGELSGSVRVTGGNLGSLTVAGKIAGGGGTSSGVVLVAGALSTVQVSGDLQGGTGVDSGVVSSGGALGKAVIGGGIFGVSAGTGVLKGSTSIGSVSVGASVVGGAGVGSGTIQSGGNLGSVIIGGKLKGGSGNSSGSVFSGTLGLGTGALSKAEVKLAVIGGSGSNSGVISATGKIGALILGGAQTGADQEVLGAALMAGNQSAAVNSGMIYAGGGMGTVTVNGKIQGGAASQSGSIICVGRLEGLTVNGGLVGGGGLRSGSIVTQDLLRFDSETAGSMGKVVIAGGLSGGSGEKSGRLEAAGAMGSVSILSATVGSGSGSGGIQSGAGVLEEGNVSSLTVNGALNGVTITIGGRMGAVKAGAVSGAQIAVSGSLVSFTAAQVSETQLRVGNDLGAVTVASLDETTISARGQAVPRSATTDVAIGSLTVTGNVTDSNVFAGRSLLDVATNGNAQIGKVTVGGNWVNSDLVTGTERGNAGPVAVKLAVTDSAFRVGGRMASFTAGAVSGTELRAGNDLGAVTVASLDDSVISARGQAAPKSVTSDVAIGSLTVTGNVTDSDVFAGRNLLDVATNGNAQIGKVTVSGNWLNSDLITGTQRGSVGAVVVSGAVTDSNFTVGATVASFTAGAVSGTQLRAGNDLGAVTVASLTDSLVSARGQAVQGAKSDLAIAKVTVAGSVINSEILAGYNLGGTGVNADAQIGAVVVGGDWRASSLVAGAVDADGDGFGDADDRLIAGGNAALVARIAEVTIRGGVFGTASDPEIEDDPAASDHYGFVAQQFGKFSVGTPAVVFNVAQTNELTAASTQDVTQRLVSVT